MKKIILIALMMLSINAYAGMGYHWIDVPGSGSKTVNRGYVGLKWTLNEGLKPQAVIGYRSASVDSNGDTDGGDLSISARFLDGLQLGKLRAKYFNGKENVQGEIGGGYDFTKGLFAGVGVHAPYSLIGLDFHPFLNDEKFEPYVQIDTNKKYKKVNGSSRECVLGLPWDYFNSTCTLN